MLESTRIPSVRSDQSSRLSMAACQFLLAAKQRGSTVVQLSIGCCSLMVIQQTVRMLKPDRQSYVSELARPDRRYGQSTSWVLSLLWPLVAFKALVVTLFALSNVLFWDFGQFIRKLVYYHTFK